MRKDSPDKRTYICKECTRKKYHENYVHRERKKTTLDEYRERFFNGVNVRSQNECWEWKRSVGGDGYGRFFLFGKQISAHRASYTLSFGNIKNGMCVCHSCDNPICVNPSHLFLGTNTDNMIDKVRKGRSNPPIGERAGNAKLSANDVIEIRRLYWTEKYSQSRIAKMFNLSPTYITSIVNWKCWKHIGGMPEEKNVLL